MKVKRLDVVRYPPDGSHYRVENVPSPTWPDVESAGRRLDHHEHPHANLFLDEDQYETNCLWILGGPRGYHFNANFEYGRWFQYLDPVRGDDEIVLWKTDQGFAAPARHVCPDLDLALKIVKYFCEHGQLAPFARWE